MAKISDDQLSNWTKPAFDNETERAEATQESVNDAINRHPILKDLSIRVFPKGSYANNTNVRHDSDIDIAVEFQDLINLSYDTGVSFSDTGLSPYTGISEQLFKSHLKTALISEFGNKVDTSGNKVFKIRGSDKILDADIIPCTRFRLYHSPTSFSEGIELILDVPDGRRHFNFPDQHQENGVNKNNSTSKRYKSTVRILKNINYFITPDGNDPKYHSFMIESLAYNLPTNTYIYNEPWRELLNQLCEDAWKYLKIDEQGDGGRWMEVNDIKYLFHPYQKWSRPEAKQFILDVYNLIK